MSGGGNIWSEKDAVTVPWDIRWQTDGDTSVRSGTPTEDHNCDQMGCSSVCHALEWRPATEKEREYHALVKAKVMFPTPRRTEGR